MALESVAARLFAFDPTESLARGTSMGNSMMQIALQEQALKFQVAQNAASAQLQAERNQISRRGQQFNELTSMLNRGDKMRQEQQVAAGNQAIVDGLLGGGGGSAGYSGSGQFGAGSAVDYPGQGDTQAFYGPEATEPVNFLSSPVGDFNESEAPGLGGGEFTTMQGLLEDPAAKAPPIETETIAVGNGDATMEVPVDRGQPVQESAPPSPNISFSEPPPTPSVMPATGPGTGIELGTAPVKPSIDLVVPVSEAAHKNKLDVPYDGTPANIRYNNPGAAYPRPADNKFGLEGYGVIGGGHLIGKYPTPVHGAASNMDLFAKSYKGMTFQGAVNKWRGGNGSLNVPSGYKPTDRIDDAFVSDKSKMTDFFEKMAAHESSKFDMPSEQWGEAFDLYAAGGVSGLSENAASASGSRGPEGGLFPAGTATATEAPPSPSPLQQEQGSASQPTFQGDAITLSNPDLQQPQRALLPEEAAMQKAQQSYQQTVAEKAATVQKLDELRRRDMSLTVGLSAISKGEPGWQIRATPLIREQMRVRSELERVKGYNREVLQQETVLQKALQDANDAATIARDNQQLYQRTSPDAPNRLEMIKDYKSADFDTRTEMMANFHDDTGLRASFEMIEQREKAALERQKAEAEATPPFTKEINGTRYTMENLALYIDTEPVQEELAKDPKLKAEVEALLKSQGVTPPTYGISGELPEGVTVGGDTTVNVGGGSTGQPSQAPAPKTTSEADSLF